MNTRYLMVCCAAVVLVLVASTVIAQAPSPPPPPPPYGAPISLDMARRCMAGAEAEAKKNNWNVVITVLDSGGHAVLMQRMDGTQFGSIDVANDKAYSAIAFRRPTKVFEDILAQGSAALRLLRLTGATPIEGGLPIVHGGRVIGAVGVSGVTSQQDGQIAQACVSALQ
jgi:glc operon protein GlcG